MRRPSKKSINLILNSHREPFIRHVFRLRFLVTIAILLAVSTRLSHIWLLDHANLAGVDVFVSAKKPKIPQHTVVVSVTEDDYKRIFGNCTTAKELQNIIDTLTSYGPAVLAVDVSTAAEEFRDLKPRLTSTRIVWARISSHKAIGPRDQARYEWVAGEVLGHGIVDPPYAGATLFPQDSDGVVRDAQRWIPLHNGTVPSMYWEIIRAYCDSGSQEACRVSASGRRGDTTGRWLPNRYEFPPVTLGDVLAQDAARFSKNSQAENILRDRIVILGADFGDEHPTAFGLQQGAALIATAVETELERHADPFRISGWLQIGCKFILAIVLAAIHHYFRPLFALSVTLFLLGLIVTLNFAAYYYEALRIDFVPFAIGIWIEQLYEGASHAQHHVP
ncbi:MAG: CHASE2 domain-containing protein [Bryobacteraceae bacterium]|jgi:CHASE2 domain-containing sensor protein